MQDSDEKSTMETVAQYILGLISLYGVKYMFLTTGTEWAPLQDGLAKMQSRKEKNSLIPLTIPHEVVSTGMAIGFAMRTGTPACVGVHVSVGTANALGNVMTASRARVPVLILAGKTPVTDFIGIGGRDNLVHWGQDLYDQSGLVREFVRWEYELRRTDNLPQAIARAFKMMNSSPKGPVYLTFTRELLMERPGKSSTLKSSMALGVPAPTVSQDIVKDITRKLVRAKNPLIIAGALGRNPAAFEDLVAICNSLAVPVSESVRQCANYPTNDEMHLGFNSLPLVRASDFVLVIDCMVPWISDEDLPTSLEIVQVDEDPSFPEIPMWNYPVNVQIKADSAHFLRSMREVIEKHDMISPDEKRTLNERHEKIRELHSTWKRKTTENAIAHSKDKPIDFAWLSHEINRALATKEDWVLINEFSLDMNQVEVTKPSTFFGSTSSGYLGRSLGQALGLKLASPSSTVVAAVGDGVYMFNVPEAAHWVSNAYDLPFLTIIFNNQGWETEKKPIEKFYPEGWSEKTKNFVGVNLDPPGDYCKIVTSFGGYGERVTEPDSILPAIERALSFIGREKKQVVLDVICKKI
jgi:acetolactate synthase I/II/III large subunit